MQQPAYPSSSSSSSSSPTPDSAAGTADTLGQVGTMASASIFAPDTVLDGTYRIQRLLGQGGMGDVYLAAHERLPGYFAVKALQPEMARHPESAARFRREAEILAGVRHPNVVQVVDFNVSAQGVPYLVMELVEGADLETELVEGRELGPADVISIVRQIASALDAAHAVGVVHRDLKPANVILVPAPGQAPIVKVIDFGISISAWSHQVTTESRVMGTPEYMSPEQALGRRDEIDARSDQFALAVLAHTLLAKRPPYCGDTPLATLSAIVHGEPEALVPHVSWPAHEVELVLRKGMARLREDRYASVLELTDALEAALATAGALAEPARACPSAVATASSRSGPAVAVALTVPSQRTPISGRVPAAASGSARELAMLGVPVSAKDDVVRKPGVETQRLIGRTLKRSRKVSTSISLLALLAVGGGLLAARDLRPREFQYGVDTASNLIRVGWAEASALVDRVPPMLQRLHI